MNDEVSKPAHYQTPSGLEVIDVIEAFNLTYHEGNVLKYLLRWRKKGGITDLRKALWYLNRFVEKEAKNVVQDS